MLQEHLILTTLNHGELIKELTGAVMEGVTIALQEQAQKLNNENQTPKEWLTSKEVESLLKISSVTRWNWAKRGILMPRKIGTLLRYNSKEIATTLREIESKRK